MCTQSNSVSELCSTVIFLGLTDDPELQIVLFVLFLFMYLVTVLGNFLIILLIRLDSRLHTPMYFFLTNLSLVDVSYATSVVPQLLAHFLAAHKAIPFLSCAAQLFFSLGLGGIEFVLLAMMAYDRYVAVCNPLRYSAIMHTGLCSRMAIVSWVSGSINSVMQTVITFQLPMCTNVYIDHISCELLAVVRLACVDTSTNEVAIMASSIILLMTPFCLVLLSYIQIISTILKIQSKEGRRKAFHTCASHLTVVALCYGMAIFTYIQPHSSPSVLQEKLISLFYAILTPMLNPMIYSLRNKENNQTWVHEFILLGLSRDWDTQVSLFVLFLFMYLVTVLGNVLIILLIRLDSRLHTPMYFFLTNLSLVDVSYATSIVPQLLAHFLAAHKAIPFLSCAAQLFFSLGLGGIEFLLLAVMAYDRYVAVCDPLRYSVIMHAGLCLRLVITSWVSGSINSLVHTAITFQLPMCTNKYIDHISCEILAVVRLACVDTSSNEIVIMVSSIVLLMTPFFLVLLSYIQIISTILKIQSTEGRKKAFQTCASHLTVVTLCYGTTIFTYIQPHSNPSVLQEKLISLFYAVLMPMLNPMIYSLRNKEVKEAWQKLLGKFSGFTSKLTQ
ncbi:olfactory receptor-like protein OLF3-like protein [Cricetulus griseus]|nr:olfactory receptor-like protein OLF3-like protein [Cricetulus griseus]